MFGKGYLISNIILIAIALFQHKGSFSIGGSIIGGSIGTEIFERESHEEIANNAVLQHPELSI